MSLYSTSHQEQNNNNSINHFQPTAEHFDEVEFPLINGKSYGFMLRSTFLLLLIKMSIYQAKHNFMYNL